QPRDNNLAPLVTGTSNLPLVTPDGRQLIFVQDRIAGDTVKTAVVALASDTDALQWRADVASRALDEYQRTPYALAVNTAVAGDRVYVVTYHFPVNGPVAVIALDRASGQERAHWDVDLAGNTVNSVDLLGAPDGRYLYLVASLGGNADPQFAYIRYHLPDGRAELRQAPVVQPGPRPVVFWPFNSRFTPDGRALYQVTTDRAGAVVDFFDLDTGAILPPVDLPFQLGTNGAAFTESTISNDGHRLYVLSPGTAELAVVNLDGRRLEQVLPLDTSAVSRAGAPSLLARARAALGGLVAPAAAAKEPFFGTMQLSPDGRRLYAVGVKRAGAAGAADGEPTGDGIWAIDTATWKVTAHWLPGVLPQAMFLSADGRYLYVQDWQGQGGGNGLHVVDTAAGKETYTSDALAHATGNYAQLSSLTELYREAYGRSPATAGVQPQDSGDFTPVASLEVSASPAAALAGDQITIEARFVDPATGAPVAPGQQTPRYTPPARVAAAICAQAPCGAPTIALQPAGYGVYRGTTTLDDHGVWNLSVVATWSDGLTRRALRGGAVTVRPAFAATDGRRYVLAIASDPAQPVVNRVATVRAAFVDAATGAPLPAGVTLVDGLPASLDVAYFAERNNSQSGVSSSHLAAAGHGVYRGDANLWSAEPWRVEISLTTKDGRLITFTAGVLQVTGR
ncbi:MAG TPA: hypothetical protein VFW96_21790, partial [Thermomicrobiales bacterium]|nr:hypothetical protein [Thermomicrobiales bacterium]